MSDDQDTMDEWAAALAEAEGTDDSSEVKVTELDELDDSKHELSGEEKRKLDTILDIPVTISMEVGRSKINIRNLLQLNQGSVVELDRVAGEPL
ncbi:MAG: FliM/FliN family flagellar motor switch protein, partial [Pseudoalteromonas tetraodonis]